MPTREEIVRKAREYVGTPFQHQARIKGQAVDCVGLVVGVMRELGMPVTDRLNYPAQANGQLVPEIEHAGFVRTDRRLALPGDLLLFWITRRGIPHHVGIAADVDGEPGIIHAFQTAGRVADHVLDDWWATRLHSVWAFPGVD